MHACGSLRLHAGSPGMGMRGAASGLNDTFLCSSSELAEATPVWKAHQTAFT